MSYPGWPSLCLRAADLERSKKFYMMAGMNLVSEVPGKRAILGFGNFRIALMTFLDENLVNIRDGDVFSIYERMRSEIPDLDGEPENYTAEQYDADADGVCWSTRDPDGNMVFFDTNLLETGPALVDRRSVDILDGALEELTAIGADQALVRGLDQLRKSFAPKTATTDLGT